MKNEEHTSKNATALEVLSGKDLSGKVMLITGANSGIGYETARALALSGCHIFLACRNLKTANEAKQSIINECNSAKVGVLQLDLNDLKSVENCARNFLDLGLSLHCLVLNAGVLGPQKHMTDDGFESTFQINHLAHFYLTELLTDKLIESAPARVIVVSSSAHKYAIVAFRQPRHITWDIICPKQASNWGAIGPYIASKFFNILFTRELNDLLKSKGVTAYSLHPGIVDTNVFRNPDKWIGFAMKKYRAYMKTPEQGASTTVYLAASEGIEDLAGNYFSNCKVKQSVKQSRNKANAEKLWQVSEEMIKHFKANQNADNVTV